MVRSEVYRQSTGSILNSGADLATCLSQSLPFRTTVHSPILSKVSLFELSRTTLSILGHLVPRCVRLFTFFIMLHSAFHRENISYHKVKQTATTYQAAKQSLLGPSAPFASWIVSGEEWESFDAHGELPGDVRTPLS